MDNKRLDPLFDKVVDGVRNATILALVQVRAFFGRTNFDMRNFS